jgi:gamma-glutamyltranspeptidase/glutathione hydrolase
MRHGGLISAKDLQSYRALPAQPIELDYRGYQVSTVPSSGGVIVAQLLLSLEKFGAFQLLPGSPDELHLFAELARRAQADRRFGAGRASAANRGAEPPLAERLERFARLDFAPFDPWHATASRQLAHGALVNERESEHTTQLSVVDRDGNAVSCTTTLSASFGARYVVPGTGIVMNNSLAGFGIGAANQPRAGRRIQSSMAPTLVAQGGRVVAVLGSPGGDTIPSTVVQVLRHLIDHGMTIDAAIEAPRVHHGFFPDELRLERGRSPDPSVLAELQARGHSLNIRSTAIGAANDILVVDGVAYGHADSREGGLALAAPPPPR